MDNLPVQVAIGGNDETVAWDARGGALSGINRLFWCVRLSYCRMPQQEKIRARA